MKKTAILILAAILLGLFIAGSLIAEEQQLERFTLDIYVTVYSVSNNNDVDIGYLDMYNNEWSVHHYTGVQSGQTIHCQIEIGPPDDPPAEWVFAEGWGGGYHDRDKCDADLYYPMYLTLYLGLAPDRSYYSTRRVKAVHYRAEALLLPLH